MVGIAVGKIFTQHVVSQIKELKGESKLLTCQSCSANQAIPHLLIESQVSFLSYSITVYFFIKSLKVKKTKYPLFRENPLIICS
jgi:hypothetical protein